MSILDKANRDQLIRLQAELVAWKEKSPNCALGVHRLLDSKIQTIGHELAKFHVKDDIRQRYQVERSELQRFVLLLEIQQDLAVQLEKKLDELQSVITKEPSSIQSYFQQEKKQWQSVLASVWICDKDIQLDAVKQKIKDIQKGIDLFKNAVDAFQRAAAIIKKINNNPAMIAALENALNNGRTGLIQKNITDEDIKKIEQLCKPLEEILRQPIPQEIGNVGRALTELRNWDEYLNIDTTKTREFERRKRKLDSPFSNDELAQLSQEVNAEIKERVDKATKDREERYQKLFGLHTQLFKASDRKDNDIKQSAEKLKKLSTVVPDGSTEHKEWIADFEQIQQNFDHLINHYATAISEKLSKQAEIIQREIDALKLSQLTHSSYQRVENLQQEIFKLTQLTEPKELLGAWQKINELSTELETIKYQSEQDKRDFEIRKQQLLNEFLRFDAEAKKMDFNIEDLKQSSIDAINEINEMDIAIGKIAELTQKLATEKERFKNVCQTQFTNLKAEISEIQQVLSEAGKVLEPPKVINSCSLATDENQLYSIQKQQLQNIKTELETEIPVFLNLFDAAITNKQQQLRQLFDTPLHPYERDEITRLLQDYSNEQSALIQLTDQTVKLQDIKKFLAERKNDVEELIKLCDNLKKRLREIIRTPTVYYSKERTERITDLLYGLPEQIQSIHFSQLHMVEKLLTNLEQQIKRQIAEDTRKQINYLNENNHRLKEEYKTLLLDINRYGHKQALPAQLREQLNKAVINVRRAS
jgi:DNA repair exonuclease SbcCD ATPase subunit